GAADSDGSVGRHRAVRSSVYPGASSSGQSGFAKLVAGALRLLLLPPPRHASRATLLAEEGRRQKSPFLFKEGWREATRWFDGKIPAHAAAEQSMADISRRAQELGTENAFVVLAEVNKLIRDGRDIMSFCIGQPDFHTPVNIQDAAVKAIREGKHGYTPSAGILELR